MRNWLTNLTDVLGLRVERTVEQTTCMLKGHDKSYRFNTKALGHPFLNRLEVTYYQCTRCKADGLEFTYYKYGLKVLDDSVPQHVIKQILMNKRSYEERRSRKRIIQRNKGRRKVLFEKFDYELAKKNYIKLKNKKVDVYEA